MLTEDGDAEVRGDSLWLVAAYVVGVLGIGLMLARVLRLERESGWLLASGTAICGGTAIATLAPLVGARADQVGVAIGIVFLLNAAALFGFPVIGHWLGMSQLQFGMWAALAIHDTSSVLATAAIYGNEALEIATTVKLGRTLWLIPLTLIVSLAQRASAARVRVPPFIVAFIAVSVLTTVLPLPAVISHGAGRVSKALLVTALFFIGTEISWATLRLMRGRVLVHALLLWTLAGSATGLAGLPELAGLDQRRLLAEQQQEVFHGVAELLDQFGGDFRARHELGSVVVQCEAHWARPSCILINWAAMPSAMPMPPFLTKSCAYSSSSMSRQVSLEVFDVPVSGSTEMSLNMALKASAT
jgi:uncharacterized integral membrane protein (TIGR00698 family)